MNNTSLIDPNRGVKRDSGIELLKIISIFLIIISHVAQAIGTNYGPGTFSDYVIELGNSTTDITTLILTSLRYLGGIGNNVFFICTAWFMIDREPRSKKKILTMAFDVWVISVIMLGVVLCFRNGDINGDLYGLIISLLPITFGSNWYATCYILFCLVHPYLNLIIRNIGRRQLLRVTTFMALTYILINYFIQTAYFPSRIIVWIAIYFLIAYLKKYCRFINNFKYNILMLVMGIAGNLAAILITNYLGLRFDMFYDKMLYWYQNNSPFLIMISFGLFNIFRQTKFKSRFINYISSLSLYVYLIHGHYLLAKYCRSAIWHEIFIRFGHDYVLLWVFVYSAVLFVGATFVSMIYKFTLHKLVVRILDKVYPFAKNAYTHIEDKILALK